ncbi:hypothetical protein BN59_03264 [Legionella massiliensis]|uniref:Uncharacterized protein n=1 Tax=Legionella massiliensis TaxID=1034943 RepID=A0A078L4E5_9GAMM|nr:hypothetical protein BN59_03264 [Legionella massiliensis]CEE14687.1 hypothetical protein BN1094_03264 [Legionella massiliensis]
MGGQLRHSDPTHKILIDDYPYLRKTLITQCNQGFI